jgi:membrane protease YdiL (CAAX protease family)
LNIAPSKQIITSVGTLGPLLACYVTHRISAGNWRAVRLLPSRWSDWVWFLLGPLLVFPCLFVVLPILISLAPPQSWLRHIDILQKIPVLMFNYNLLGGPLSEEFGWRGFLQPRAQEVLPPWAAAVCVGIMWAGWHLPLFFVEGWISISRTSYLLTLIGLSVIMAFAFNASGKSVAVAIVMHSAFNASMQLVVAYLEGIPMRPYPKGEWFLAGAFLLPASILVMVTRGHLAARRTP